MEKLLRQALNKNKTLKVKLKGSSMWPFLKGGEDLIISSAEYEDILTGDIILYSESDDLVCHRAYAKRGGCFQVKADAATRPDRLIIPEQFIGKVVAVEKREMTLRLDNIAGRVLNILVLYLSFFTAFLYLLMVKIKNAKRTLGTASG